MRLRSSRDVTGKEDHARWLNLREQGSEAWRHLGPVEADDEELADFSWIGRGFLRRCHQTPNVSSTWNLLPWSVCLEITSRPTTELNPDAQTWKLYVPALRPLILNRPRASVSAECFIVEPFGPNTSTVAPRNGSSERVLEIRTSPSSDLTTTGSASSWMI